MGMTVTQKILAKHAGFSEVVKDQLIEARVDLVLGNDITAPIAINEFNKLSAKDVFDKDKVVIVMDHFTPNKDIKAAEQCAITRRFAKEHSLKNFYDSGRAGIEHALLPEQGLVGPGNLVIGADSHTCTYGALGAFSTGVGSTDMAAAMITGKSWFKVPAAVKINLNGKPSKFVSGKDIILHIIGLIGVDGARYKSMEFFGEGIKYLSIYDRFTICNMVIEAGAKNGIFPVDYITSDYINGRFNGELEIFEPDKDAEYEKVIDVNLGELTPTVARPHLPSNTVSACELGGVKVDQVVIGSCTNGFIEDLRVAADILKDRQVKNDVRCIIIPATQDVYMQALEEGLIKIFIKANAVVSTPTCGPCLGGHMGILAKGEIAVSTTNRNFVGRMGHVESKVYLSSPAVAAASAITGYITDPNNI